MSEQLQGSYLIARMSQRALNAIQWINLNPILAEGEIGFEIDTNLVKVGDGQSTWTMLPYQYGIDVVYQAGEGIEILDNREIRTTLQYEERAPL